jgi:hypothetical protein
LQQRFRGITDIRVISCHNFLKGIPDIRVIVFNHVPVMAMLRLPTKESDGKANLQHGALGLGIDLSNGTTTTAVQGIGQYAKSIEYAPDTRLVLGGYSLGAAVTDVVLAVPSPVFGYSNPLPLGMDDHIAAVALFGNGTRKVLGPVSAISPLYGDKTIDLCTADDPICNDNLDPNTWVDNWPAHQYAAYVDAGLVDLAAKLIRPQPDHRDAQT